MMIGLMVKRGLVMAEGIRGDPSTPLSCAHGAGSCPWLDEREFGDATRTLRMGSCFRYGCLPYSISRG